MARPDDWSSPEFVAHYNRLYRMSPQEGAAILEPLDLKAEDRFVDYGCGDGSFLAVAAGRVAFAVGVDVSREQIVLARRGLEGRANVQLVEDSFLSFVDSWSLGPTFSKAFSRKALHHLVDEDKRTFCGGMAKQLLPGARFLLEDAVYDFSRSELAARMPEVLREAQSYFGADWDAKKDDFRRMLDHEFPTGFDCWKSCLEDAGFSIVRRGRRTGFISTILARKER